MKVQIEESIIINDKEFVLLSKSLDPFLKLLDKDLKLVPFGSNFWRGYYETWTIMNNVLYLTHIILNVMPEDKEKLIPLLLDDVIIQAWWYTCELRVQYHRTSDYYPLHEKHFPEPVKNHLLFDCHRLQPKYTDIVY